MEKNNFKVSKNLTRYRSKIILINYQNNYVECLNWLLEYQIFLEYCSSCLSFQHNYFDDSIKLFLDLYLTKFLHVSAKSFFSCTF